jgi:transcription elongation factor GreA
MAFEYLTQEGYDKVKNELEILKTEGRAKAAQAIAEARAQGDLSENAEYDAAKDAQGLLELKINTLEKVLSNARVLDMAELDTSKAVVFSKVTIKNLVNKQLFTYQLVSETEANLKEKKISVTSPIGSGLLGKKVGEIAEIKTPSGVMKFEVTSISF